jgi:hypothetical protein
VLRIAVAWLLVQAQGLVQARLWLRGFVRQFVRQFVLRFLLRAHEDSTLLGSLSDLGRAPGDVLPALL